METGPYELAVSRQRVQFGLFPDDGVPDSGWLDYLSEEQRTDKPARLYRGTVFLDRNVSSIYLYSTGVYGFYTGGNGLLPDGAPFPLELSLGI